MITIKEKDFEMFQVKDGPFFDLSVLSKVNAGKSDEREEMKIVAYGIPFESAIKYIVSYKLLQEDAVYSVSELVEKYKEIVKEVSTLIKCN